MSPIKQEKEDPPQDRLNTTTDTLPKRKWNNKIWAFLLLTALVAYIVISAFVIYEACDHWTEEIHFTGSLGNASTTTAAGHSTSATRDLLERAVASQTTGPFSE